MLRRADPVGVDRPHVRRVGLPAPLEQEALGGGLAGLDDGAVDRRRVPVRDARRLRDDVERRRRQAPQVFGRLLVRDVDQLAELPLGRQRGKRRLQVGGRVAGEALRRVRLGGRQSRCRRLVDEQPPDLLERNLADELLDIDAAVAERAALAVRLGDLRAKGDDALEPFLDLGVHGSSSSISRPTPLARAAFSTSAAATASSTATPTDFWSKPAAAH